MGKTRTSVKLLANQKAIADKPLQERSRLIEEALTKFLSWECYVDEDWSMAGYHSPSEDGQPWLDSVELGVEYRTRSRLLAPCVIEIRDETNEHLEVAIKRVESARTRLAGKGIKSGIIRAALAQQQLIDMYGQESA
ncbi:hypothetical protein [Marinimicrobium sp. ABcell2]|uniref:hypothetical protein n=1 Tax=Marinimicrobium sp. ABcell2 TaxID=3069751 RepID=UPI0027ADB715|nr:hypothetical protein [Marinimicrobium sp. ABcell2]MDQ2077407.1 hypothetical protein [Marinimicrobium sp. ABcell2]